MFVRQMNALQAAALSPELEACKADIERAGIDGVQLTGLSEFDIRELAASVGGGRFKEELFAQLKGVKEVCEAQVATMRHFEE